MRYYGFYAWLSFVSARQVGDTNPRRWQRFIRRAEALYALIAQQRGGEPGVAGILWAQRKLAGSGPGAVAFAEDAEPGSPTHYLKQAWGAYGAAYQSQLFEIGVFSAADAHEIPVPSHEIGEELAECFDAACGPLAGRFIEAVERGEVLRTELDSFAPLTPTSIDPNGEERQLYERVLFADAGLHQAADLERRKTMQMIL
jgi:hypothetical protein